MTEPAEKQQPEMGNNNLSDGKDKTEGNKPAVKVEDLQAELDIVRKALKNANKEAETRRKKLEGYEEKERLAKEANLSEMEKLQKQFDDLKTEKEKAVNTANAKLIKAEILAKASKFIDGDVVYALLDKSKVTVNDDGAIEGVDALLDELAKAKPHLLKGKTQSLDTTNPGAGATNETREQKKARLTGVSSDIFAGKGGGVVWAPGSFPEG